MAVTKRMLYGSQVLGGSIDKEWVGDNVTFTVRHIAARVVNNDTIIWSLVWYGKTIDESVTPPVEDRLCCMTSRLYLSSRVGA